MQDINILLTNQDHQRATVTYHLTCADLEGGQGGPDPPWNLQSLTLPILLEVKKTVIFHICALPQLYVKQNQSYLRLDPPWKNFLDPRLI